MRALEQHSWPGNIRELRNTIERLLLLAEDEVDETLTREVLPRAIRSTAASSANGSGPLASRVEAFERETIRGEMERSRYNMTETARVLGLERSHFYKKCTQLGIDVKQLRRSEE